MAKINIGILGGFIGKVGAVVGYIVDGKAIIKALPPAVRRDPTDKQARQQSMMAITIKFLLSMFDYVKVGWAAHCHGMTELNAASSYILKNAFIDDNEETKLDYRRVLISRGELPHRVHNVSASILDCVVSLAWEDNSIVAEANEDDVSMPLAYNIDKGLSAFDLSGGSRASSSTRLELPADWLGDSVVIYLAFRSPDFARVSDSFYISRLTVQ